MGGEDPGRDPVGGAVGRGFPGGIGHDGGLGAIGEGDLELGKDAGVAGGVAGKEGEGVGAGLEEACDVDLGRLPPVVVLPGALLVEAGEGLVVPGEGEEGAAGAAGDIELVSEEAELPGLGGGAPDPHRAGGERGAGEDCATEEEREETRHVGGLCRGWLGNWG